MATASGIGLAAVKAFLDEGANVVTDETQGDPGQRAEAELGAGVTPPTPSASTP
ncbi:hypothetical protein [Brevibacterium oceani]|uniref:hypothetical protein n=1 Tax=Brevibacterium oceani TaxID=358099 RepID=UPI001B33DAE9|nr:hypothetical protein [Brevibacterium oceani]